MPQGRLEIPRTVRDAFSQHSAGVSVMAGCAFPDCNPIQDPPGAALRSHFLKKRSEMCVAEPREGSLLATLWDVTREAIKIVHSYCEDSPACRSLKAYTQLGRHGALFSLATPMFTSMLNSLRMNLTLLHTCILTLFSSVKLKKKKGKPSQPHWTEGIEENTDYCRQQYLTMLWAHTLLLWKRPARAF